VPVIPLCCFEELLTLVGIYMQNSVMLTLVLLLPGAQGCTPGWKGRRSRRDAAQPAAVEQVCRHLDGVRLCTCRLVGCSAASRAIPRLQECQRPLDDSIARHGLITDRTLRQRAISEWHSMGFQEFQVLPQTGV
jgi:hypothetical protein